MIPEKAKIIVENGKEIIVMFNPTEYSTSLNATWEKGKSGGQGTMPQYKGTAIGDFSVTLFFDSYEKGEDVREVEHGTKAVALLALPDKDKKRPLQCTFSWGKFNYKGVVKSVSQKFTMFLSSGIPVRATLTLNMSPVLTEKEILKLQGVSESRKLHIVKDGDRLDLIAENLLGDKSLWHKIADENNIADPLNFPPKELVGQEIFIPHLEL